MSPSLCLITAALLTAQVPGDRLEAVPVDAAPTAVVAPRPGCNCGASAPQQFVPIAEPEHERPGLFPRLAHRLHSLLSGDEESEPAPGRFQGQVIPQGPADFQGQVIPQGPVPAQGPTFEEQSPPMDQEPPLAGPPQKGTAAATITVTDVQGLPPGTQILDGAVPPGAQVIEGPLPPGVQVIEEVAQKLPAQAGHDAQYHRITGRLHFLPSGGGTWILRYGDSDSDRYGGLVELSTAANLTNLHSGDLVTADGEILNTGASSNPASPLFRATTVRLVEHAQ